MQKRLHNFMDKMQEKSVEERRRLLFISTSFFGVFITVFGLWNISNNLISLNTSSAGSLAVEEKADAPSPFSSLADNIAGVWASVRGGLEDLNNKLGSSSENSSIPQEDYVGSNTINTDYTYTDEMDSYDQVEKLNTYEE